LPLQATKKIEADSPTPPEAGMRPFFIGCQAIGALTYSPRTAKLEYHGDHEDIDGTDSIRSIAEHINAGLKNCRVVIVPAMQFAGNDILPVDAFF
jgi:hypothetical protein